MRIGVINALKASNSVGILNTLKFYIIRVKKIIQTIKDK
jgi:hypothetical protein